VAKWKLVSKHEFEPASFLAAYRYNWFAFPVLLAAGHITGQGKPWHAPQVWKVLDRAPRGNPIGSPAR
jgi:hypothetical protein